MMEQMTLILVLVLVLVIVALPVAVAWLLGLHVGRAWDWRVGGLGLSYMVMKRFGKRERVWAVSLYLGPLTLDRKRMIGWSWGWIPGGLGIFWAKRRIVAYLGPLTVRWFW